MSRTIVATSAAQCVYTCACAKEGAADDADAADAADADADAAGEDYSQELTALPRDLSACSLSVEDCPALCAVPAGLRVSGLASFFRCGALEELPADLRCGALRCVQCCALRRLPVGLSCEGAVLLDFCTALSELPAGLSCGGDLGLKGCSRLARLPEGLRVGGALQLLGCRSLPRSAAQALPCGAIIRGPVSGPRGEEWTEYARLNVLVNLGVPALAREWAARVAALRRTRLAPLLPRVAALALADESWGDPLAGAQGPTLWPSREVREAGRARVLAAAEAALTSLLHP